MSGRLGDTPLAQAADVVIKRGDHVAVSASSFTLEPVGVTAIIGPNGSGKTTLLHALAGLLPVAAGSLQVAGRDPSNPRRRLSYVQQTVDLARGIPLTVREAVTMGRYAQRGWFGWIGREDRTIVDEAMQRLRVADLAKRHVGELSGGQRQRVMVAQGIAQDHDILLLDEPLTGLDLVSARTIDEIIHDEHSCGCHVVMTTHDLAEARAADTVVLMSGRVVAHGRPADVLTRQNLVDAYGLGELHEPGDAFFDDPGTHPHHTAS